MFLKAKRETVLDGPGRTEWTDHFLKKQFKKWGAHERGERGEEGGAEGGRGGTSPL